MEAVGRLAGVERRIAEALDASLLAHHGLSPEGTMEFALRADHSMQQLGCSVWGARWSLWPPSLRLPYAPRQVAASGYWLTLAARNPAIGARWDTAVESLYCTTCDEVLAERSASLAERVDAELKGLASQWVAAHGQDLCQAMENRLLYSALRRDEVVTVRADKLASWPHMLRVAQAEVQAALSAVEDEVRAQVSGFAAINTNPSQGLRSRLDLLEQRILRAPVQGSSVFAASPRQWYPAYHWRTCIGTALTFAVLLVTSALIIPRCCAWAPFWGLVLLACALVTAVAALAAACVIADARATRHRLALQTCVTRYAEGLIRGYREQLAAAFSSVGSPGARRPEGQSSWCEAAGSARDALSDAERVGNRLLGTFVALIWGLVWVTVIVLLAGGGLSAMAASQWLPCGLCSVLFMLLVWRLWHGRALRQNPRTIQDGTDRLMIALLAAMQSARDAASQPPPTIVAGRAGTEPQEEPAPFEQEAKCPVSEETRGDLRRD